MARRTDDQPRPPFTGFDRPESNWFRMPNSWTDITAGIGSIAELKVVEYILRHTWGYQEYGEKKHITIDEFVHGRRRHDGERMDRGTGLSERAVYDGLRKAVEDGLIEEEVDDSDRGRTRKSYSLRMRPERGEGDGKIAGGDLQTLQPGVQSLHPPLQSLPARGADPAPRSEKETLERHDSIFEFRKAHHEINASDGNNGPGPGQRAARQDEAADHRSTVPLGELLAERARQADRPQEQPLRRRGRPPGTAEEREIVTAYLRDWAVAELGDEAPLSSSVTRALAILKGTGLPAVRWPDLLYQARAITKEHSAQITKKPEKSERGFATKNRMPYFLAVLEDVAGLRDNASTGQRTNHRS